MRIEIKPSDFECYLKDCPPGLFLKENMIGLKTEYGHCEAFCDTGEAFWSGAKGKEELARVKVVPLEYEVIDEDE